MHQVGDLPVFEMQNTKLRGWGRVLKRLFDIVVSLVGIIVLSPMMLLVAILIKIDDPKGNILWLYLDDGVTVVKRVGYMRRLFYCFKFRTMKSKSHMMRYKELADKDIRGDELVKIGDDPRVTRVGKYLRRFDLDELPQLFNVLIGNMSLVGPRPHLPEEVARYKDHHQFVFNIKPGVTGLSQINGRSDLSFENEVKLDSYYIENWSLILDVKILLKTVLVIFERHGEDKS
jgi:lipopolysaccharide/colanic/teichoic acid biosynthesis glycosyltransferase